MKNPEQAGAPKESKESRYRSFKVRAGKDELGAAPTGDKVRFTPLAAVRPGGSRAASAVETTDVPSDAIARVTLDNGFELWVRADDLMQEAGVKAEARSDGEVLWDIGDLNAGATTSRGLGSALGLATRVIEFFGIDLKKEAHEFAARRLGAHFERKILGRDPGLYSCAIGTMTLGAKLDAVAAPDKPLLLFIHGTASSFDGSFGKLGADEKAAGSAACDRLHGVYGDRVYAFEHRSLTVSPIQNALELAEALPQHAELHLVSHSRGGLVGELLCLGQRVRTSDPLRAEVLKRLFVGDVAIAQQLNIEPLDEEGRKRLQDDYAADRDNLLKLSALLDMKQFRITRFVRVACPAMGTTLASGRLDRWFSLLLNAGRIAGLQHVPLVPEALDFIAAVLRERTDPRVLPGLEAMMPGSAVVRLLNHPETQTTADLTVIAGDIEGGHSFLSSLKVFVTDWFYKGEHDLVVNTGSMFGGIKRPERGARQQMDKGDAVNHFSYFHNPRTVDWLLQGLTRADGSDAGFRPISERPPTPPAWRSAIARSHAGGLPKPLAVVLPGTMGSSLKANGDRVWLDYRTLAFGGLEKIGIDAAQIEVDGLVDAFYAPLLVHLAQTHRVEFFAYDWRNSVQAAAQQLADQLSMWLPALQAQGQPVHIVAHSMGGLVVRAMMADRKGAEVWQRICELPNSRLLMLGTPNHGSHEAVRWLSGRNPTQFKLMLLDLMNSRDGIIDIVRRYPGLVELLPFPADASAVRYDEPALWSELRDALGESWKPADATVLRNARRTWDKLNGAIDAQRMIYVAGVQPQTVCGHALIQDDGAFRFNRRKLVFEQTPEGDGTVTWASGRLPGVPMYFAKGTSHDELCSRDFGRQTFAGYTDLLLKGTTTRLAREMDVSRGMRSAATPAASHSTSPPPFDSVPSAADIERLTFGPGNPAPPEADTLPGLEVQLTHGDLCYVKHPLMVGHYLGDSIVSAEKALDGQLMHARERIGPLTQRMDLGLYPGPIGSSAVFYNESSQARPIAAIIVGLGELGSLSPGRLESTVSEALLTYCFELAQMPEHKSPIKRADMRSMGLSSVLIGSGAGGMNLRDSIEALLRAVVNTNRRLMDARLADRVYISKLQLIELYQDVAINAADALEDVMASVDFRADVRWPDQTVHAGDGGCRRVSFENRDDWWHRLEISTDPDDSRLRFVSSTNRARAEETIGLGQLSLAGQFIERACAQPGRNREAARTLFDMLLPNRLKELAPDNNNLLLVLDEKSAAYPWELLEDRWATSPLPPAARSGLLRSLKTQRIPGAASARHRAFGSGDRTSGSRRLGQVHRSAGRPRRGAARCRLPDPARLPDDRLHRCAAHRHPRKPAQTALAHPASGRSRRTRLSSSMKTGRTTAAVAGSRFRSAASRLSGMVIGAACCSRRATSNRCATYPNWCSSTAATSGRPARSTETVLPGAGRQSGRAVHPHGRQGGGGSRLGGRRRCCQDLRRNLLSERMLARRRFGDAVRRRGVPACSSIRSRIPSAPTSVTATRVPAAARRQTDRGRADAACGRCTRRRNWCANSRTCVRPCAWKRGPTATAQPAPSPPNRGSTHCSTARRTVPAMNGSNVPMCSRRSDSSGARPVTMRAPSNIWMAR
jgi:hypothetical protein